VKPLKHVWNRETHLGRFEIINQCHVPAFNKEETEQHNVNPALCKALLRYLSFCAPDARQYRSNERVAHEMGMRLKTLNGVIKALKGGC
jgi:hypothetical protein